MTAVHKSELVYTAGFLDPAGGKDSKNNMNARSAIVVVSADLANRYFVRYAWADRISTDSLIEKIYEVGRMFPLNLFGIEGNAQQGLFADAVIRDAREKQIRIPLTVITHSNTQNKDFRIRTHLQLPMAQGRIILRSGDRGILDLKEEILSFPMTSLKDMIDCLASAISIIPKFPTLTENRAEDDAYLQHLRDSGASPHYIEQEARRLDRSRTPVSNMNDYLSLVKARVDNPF